MAQIHRFHDTAALYVGGNATVYLTPKEARDIARALQACARDIEARRFVESEFRTVETVQRPAAYGTRNSAEYTQKRKA